MISTREEGFKFVFVDWFEEVKESKRLSVTDFLLVILRASRGLGRTSSEPETKGVLTPNERLARCGRKVWKGRKCWQQYLSTYLKLFSKLSH